MADQRGFSLRYLTDIDACARPHDLTDAEILERLPALNLERSTGEKEGQQ